MQTTLCDRYQLGDSKTTKIIIIERLFIAIEAEQVPTSENANIDKFTRFQTFAQIAITTALNENGRTAMEKKRAQDMFLYILHTNSDGHG